MEVVKIAYNFNLCNSFKSLPADSVGECIMF